MLLGGPRPCAHLGLQILGYVHLLICWLAKHQPASSSHNQSQGDTISPSECKSIPDNLTIMLHWGQGSRPLVTRFQTISTSLYLESLQVNPDKIRMPERQFTNIVYFSYSHLFREKMIINVFPLTKLSHKV